MIRIYTVPSYFQGPRISRILYIYNVISQLYVTRIDVAREQNRFTVVVSLGIHTRVAILFSHRPANAKKANAFLGEREFMLVGCSNISAPILLFSLPTDCFPTRSWREIFVHLSLWRVGRRNLKTRYDILLYIYIFFVYIRKVIYVEYNDLINLIFFFSYWFLVFVSYILLFSCSVVVFNRDINL